MLEHFIPMNITHTLDGQVVQTKCDDAQKIGKCLNPPLLDHVAQLAESSTRIERWAQFEARCLESGARRNGWQFNRDEVNER